MKYVSIYRKAGKQELTKNECLDSDTKLLHRLHGPAITWNNGIGHWYKDGNRHRLDGPAIEWPDGSYEWYKDGKRHRLDGPAVEWNDGTIEWWVDGKELDRVEIETFIKENDINLKTLEGRFAFKLRWS